VAILAQRSSRGKKGYFDLGYSYLGTCRIRARTEGKVKASTGDTVDCWATLANRGKIRTDATRELHIRCSRA